VSSNTDSSFSPTVSSIRGYETADRSTNHSVDPDIKTLDSENTNLLPTGSVCSQRHQVVARI